MGFFNTIKINTECPKCRNNVLLTIQFKYGEDWMHNYSINDKIVWGQKNIGKMVRECVLVSGISEECPICNECSDFVVEIINNVIKRVYVDEIQLSSQKTGFSVVK